MHCMLNFFHFWPQESILDHLFGHLGVSAVHAAQQALLSLYSYKDTTGIVGRFSAALIIFFIPGCIIVLP